MAILDNFRYVCKKIKTMKNVLIIDIDTEREQPVLLGKPEAIPEPENHEQVMALLGQDLNACSDAIITLIHMGEVQGYLNRDVAIKQITDYINGTFENIPKAPVGGENKSDVDSTTPSDETPSDEKSNE